MVDYANLLSRAQAMITANGRSVTFLSHDPTPADASKPWRGPSDVAGGGSVELVKNAVFVHPSSARDLGASARSDDLVKRSEQVLIVSGADDLTSYEGVTDGSVRWNIEGLSHLKPGDTLLLSYVFVSR